MTLDEFIADMRRKGMHVGLGTYDHGVCVICDEWWPCSTARAQRAAADAGSRCSDNAPGSDGD